MCDVRAPEHSQAPAPKVRPYSAPSPLARPPRVLQRAPADGGSGSPGVLARGARWCRPRLLLSRASADVIMTQADKAACYENDSFLCLTTLIGAGSASRTAHLYHNKACTKSMHAVVGSTQSVREDVHARACLHAKSHSPNSVSTRCSLPGAPAALGVKGVAADKRLQVRQLAQGRRQAPGRQRHRVIQLLGDGVHLQGAAQYFRLRRVFSSASLG